MPDINIVDTRNLIRIIRQTYGYDFGRYAITHLRFRLDNFIRAHHIRYTDILIQRISEEPSFFMEFLEEIPVPSTEIFRDPAMWKALYAEILPILHGHFGKVNIWMPSCVGGNELFSLIILLEQTGLEKKTSITASFLSGNSMSKVKSGQVAGTSIELGIENYKTAGFTKSLNEYIIPGKGGYTLQSSILSRVNFICDEPGEPFNHDCPHLILYRNRMLELASEAGKKILTDMVQSLQPGGFIVTGNKERILHLLEPHGVLKVFNREEMIYRKKFD